jgi:hypothetical protein
MRNAEKQFKGQKKPWRKGKISRAVTPYGYATKGPAQGGEAGGE